LNALAGKVPEEVRVTVEPGVCGFQCTLRAKRIEKQRIHIEITGSDCKNVNQMATLLEDMLLGTFAPQAEIRFSFRQKRQAVIHPALSLWAC
jgi:hypothetical protein